MTSPRISVSLPVYNGAETLRRLLASVAAQSFADFQVNMVDNASADGTAEICREFADRDRRFRYYRNHRNMGVNYSFERCFFLGADSEFTVYVGHDDYWAPEYLAACLAALEARPEAAAAYSRVNLLDMAGNVSLAGHKDDFDLSEPDPAKRYLTMISRVGMLTCYYGLMRTRNLADNIDLIHYGSAAGDNIIMTSLAIEGPIIQLDEALFYRTPPGQRYHQESLKERYERLESMSAGSPRSGAGRPRLGGASLPMTSFIALNCYLLTRHAEVFDYAAQEALTAKTLQILSQRYESMLKGELELILKCISTGNIYNLTASSEGEAGGPRQGRYKFLDHVRLAGYLLHLNNYRAFVSDKAQELHYARALVLLMMGRKSEAVEALAAELNFNPTHRGALELMARLK
ncbi:MAG: glycosyltransferase family 2 protein [Candidatus Adiutrix sp.]|jgi:glycosyltransferase involved in cell wall biosynthesis|nr:glycosyltransferase family 2 protein [Candidatus Adiutrix sp.]